MQLLGFYGQTVDIPEDRLYEPQEELWVERLGDRVRIGATKVGILLMGGIETIEFFPDPGDVLSRGEELAFLETFKAVRYLVAPLDGQVLALNQRVVDEPELFDDDPYGEAWLVEMKPERDEDLAALFLEPRDYLEGLERSEHCAEDSAALLEAKKHSPTCRAVYGSIRDSEGTDKAEVPPAEQ